MAYTLNPFSETLDYYEKGTTTTGTTTHHGDLTGLSNDDHPQYHNNTRGDVRYYKREEVDALTWVETDVTDLDKYTQTEIDTISGTLQTNINTKISEVNDDLTPELAGDLSCGGYNLDNIGKYCAVSSATTICNQTGATLTKGTAVTVSGLSGETCCVIKSDNRELLKTPACGIVYADITDGNEGCMITLGRINMSTSGMTGDERDRLYVQSDGSLDTVIPTSGAVQRVGFLIKKESGNGGRICVCIRGRKSIYSAKDEHPIIRMGSDAGHAKVEFKNYADSEIMTVDSSGNLTLSGTVDTVDVATLKSDYDSHDHTESDITDLDKYTQAEVNTISGSLNNKITTLLNSNPSVNHSANGPQCNTINAGESVTIMDCVYLNSDGEWWKTSASGKTTGAGMLAISLESKTDGQAMSVALPGTFIRNDSWAWDMNENSRILYLSCTSGDLTQTVVSGTDNVVRIVGHATHADRMFFNPDQTVIVHN